MFFIFILGSLMLFIGQEKANYQKIYKKNRTTEAILLETFNNVIFLLVVKFYVII